MNIFKNKNVARIDHVYGLMNDLMRAGNFEQVDTILDFADPNGNIDYVLAILTTSSWCKNKLKNRDRFFKRVSKRWDIRISDIFSSYKMNMLDGLE